MNGAPLRGVLFDVTGTLIEPGEDVGTTYARIASRHGIPARGPRLDISFRQSLADWPEQFFPDFAPTDRAESERKRWYRIVQQTFLGSGSPLAETELGPLFEDIFDFYGRREAWRLLPGALSALEAAKDLKLRVGVVSNFDHRLETLLQDIGIAEFLDVIAHPFRYGEGKPHPVLFEAALSKLDLNAEECLFVGHDAKRDLGAARALGMATFDATLSLLPLPAQLQGLAKLDTDAPDPTEKKVRRETRP